MVFVYLENAHDISIYSPIMNYAGTSLHEMKVLILDFLKVKNNKINLEFFDKRQGVFQRKRLSSLPEDLTDVYVMLKVESIQ